MIKCRVDMAAESPRSMESWLWRHIYTSTHSWQVLLQHLLYPSLWLGLVKLCISWSNSSVYQVFLHSSDPFKSPALYPLPPLCGSSSAIWGQLSCPQGALSSPGNPQELMWPLHLQWQQCACLKQPLHTHLHGPRLAAAYNCYRKPLVCKQQQKLSFWSISSRSNQVDCVCAWHRFNENVPPVNTPHFPLKKKKHFQWWPMLLWPKSYVTSPIISLTAITELSFLGPHSHPSLMSEHIYTYMNPDVHAKDECTLTCAHTMCFIKTTNVYWAPAFCHVPEMWHLPPKHVCPVTNKGEQSSTLISHLIVLKESTSSCMFLQQELGNPAELLQLVWRMWKPKGAKRHIKM